MSDVRLLGGDEAADLLPEVRRLCYAVFRTFDEHDWEHGLGGLHAIAVEDGAVLAHAAVAPRVLQVAGQPFLTGYVENVVTDPAAGGRGLGSAVMTTLGAAIRDRYAFGGLATGRHAFYERLGWERWQGPTLVRSAGGEVRTPDEDDAIMVLRFGSSADVDLTAPISCDPRPGDDW